MRILVAYYSETGNTAKVAEAIGEGLRAKGHTVDLMTIADAAQPGELAPETLGAYDRHNVASGIPDAEVESSGGDLFLIVQKSDVRIAPSKPRYNIPGIVSRHPIRDQDFHLLSGIVLVK